MMVKTFGKGSWFVLFPAFLTLTATNLWSKVPRRGDAAQESVRVTISVYNDAEVPVGVVGRAEDQAEGVFRRAGIEVTWLNCKVPAVTEEASRACREAVFPQHLHLRFVRRSRGLKGEMMGISFQADDGSGCYADLFYEPMEELHKRDGTDVARLLGHVAAHEIGHLLLGSNSHSAAGIMHAHWTAEELASAKNGRLVFSEKESLRMKARLVNAMQASKEGPLTTTTVAISARTGD
jgi:hypothetical protein